jgi:hypothetical protein
MFYIFNYKTVDTELLGVLATLCLIPYFAFHSLTILFALLSASHYRIGLFLWCLMWLYPVVYQSIRF